MREILFKAKTKMIVGTYNSGKEDGEWVYGLLYEDVGKWMIRQFEFDKADYVSYEVDTETVCQYTGLVDKNEKKIFDGDICKYDNEMGEYGIGIICYDYVRWIGGNVAEAHTMTPLFYLKCSTEWKVIGNIFDNPELLEVQE